jgi:hypothetical protein
MAYSLSTRAKTLLEKTNIEPNIVLCIDGYDKCFGAELTSVYVTIGMDGLEIGNDWNIGGVIVDENILDYISLDGTTTSITQQLDLDKSGATSTQTVKVRLVDFQQTVTQLISPGFDLSDILYRNATLYLGFKEGAFPADYVDLFIGKVQAVESGSGFVELTIAHPDELKRSEIYPKIETTLVSDAPYYQAVIQDLTYYQNGNLSGVAQVRYIDDPFTGDVATVGVSGNLVTIQIDPSATKAKTIKQAVENNILASKCVIPLISGNPEAVQALQPITSLTVSDELELDSVAGLYLPQAPLFRTFVRINDEIIEYTGIDTALNKLTGCTRRALKSFGQDHEIEDEVTSYYKIGDGTANSNAIDLSLKIMLSKAGNAPYVTGLDELKFYNFGTPENYPNGFLISSLDAVRLHNLQIGDTCTITGSAIPGNNVTDALIEDIEVIDLGTIVYVDGASFAQESPNTATVSFKSQYNVFPDGCGFIPAQVDIDRFKLIQQRFPSSIANYELFIKDTVKPKDFINTDIFLPSALYSIPRQGKASVGISAPPLYEGGTQTLSIDTLKNPRALKINRSINKYFYNAIVFKYNEDSIEDRMLSGEIVYSADSQNRINAPNKPYTIVAKGLRPSPLNTQLITRNSKRLLERYQFAAETIPVEPDYKTGYTIEVGDSVVFGDESLQVSDTISGSRNFKPRVFEVVNKEFNWKTGSIRLHIVDTNYSAGVRYGVWSPASIISTGSTTEAIKVLNSYGSESEKDKWSSYIGKTIRVRSEDYSAIEYCKLLGFDEGDDNLILVSTLSSAPLDGYVLDVPNYDVLNLNADAFYKALHPFWTPTISVLTGVSATEFTVSLGDAAKLFEGCLIRIRSLDYSTDSYDKIIKVDTIVGGTITCDDIGFTPSAGFQVDLIGFVSDEGAPYVWL